MVETRLELHGQAVLRCYAERPTHIDAMFRTTAAARPGADALVDGGVKLTYAELDQQVERVAGGLAERGLGPGDRLAVMLQNGLPAVLSVLAAARLGAIVVPIGTRLKRPEIAYMLGDALPKALVYDVAYEPELPDAEPAAAMRFCVGASLAGSPAFAELLRSHAAVPPCQVEEDDVFGILYTSGTTGRPKGAMLTHLGAVHSCLHWQACLGLRADERALLCIPWSHVAGLCGVVLPFLCLGGRLVLMSEFKRREFLELAAAERITHALLVPAMYGLCLLEPDLATFDLSHWRLGVYGSAPMPEPTIRRFAEAVPHLVMCNAYGATETTSPATIMPPGEGLAHSDSIGKAVPCGEIRVMDEAGREVPAGELGELWIRGPMVVPGYWNDSAATQASFASGFWRSGDVGSVDEAGFVRIADRKKDMVNRGGYKVFPAEVENVLCDHAEIVEAAVIGKPDAILGERVIAFVRATRAGLSETEVRGFCSSRLADYKVPDRVVIDTEPLPRNANGKLQKHELRRTLDDRLGTAHPDPG